MKEKAQELGIKFNKNMQMYEIRAIAAGLLVQPLLIAGIMAYAFDRFTNRFTNRYLYGDKDGQKTKRIYNEADTVGADIRQAFKLQWLASPRMARAAA
jgi:hypothetical protein